MTTGPLARLWPAVLALGCGAAGAPSPERIGVPAAPSALRLLRTVDGWRIEVDGADLDVEGLPLPRPAAWGIFEARRFGDAPPLHRADAGAPLHLSHPAGSGAGELVVAAFSGRHLGPARPLHLPAWTPPPPPPPPPLAFRRPDGVVELTWLPPDEPTARVLVTRDGTSLGTFEADTAVTTDAPEGARPVYRVAVRGSDYLTAWSEGAAP